MARQDSQKLLALRRHTSGVSSALWPASFRRGVATNRAAQRRRLLIISGKWGASLVMLAQCWLLLVLVGISMLVGAIIVEALASRQGRFLLVLFMAWMAMVCVLLPILAVKSRGTLYPLWLQAVRKVRGIKHPPLTSAPHMMRDTPDTPMPAPLVRELETYDLSRSSVEHFLAPSAERVTAELPLIWQKQRASSLASSTEHRRRSSLTTQKK